MNSIFSPFRALITVGFFARLSYSLARSPVLPLFALLLGAGPEAIGFAVGISTITGIFFKLPAGALSDIIGRKKTLVMGLLVFAFMPFTYLLVHDYSLLIVIRFLHGLATSIFGPVSMALVADMCKEKHFGTAMGTFGTIFDIGHAAGPILAGILIAQVGYLHAFWVISLILVLAVPVFALNVRVENAGAG